jgi:hypothetical protein
MKISQREARRLKRRVEALEVAERSRRSAWVSEWPGGTEIARMTVDAWSYVPVSVRTARRLGHAVVVLADTEGVLRFMALPLKEP